MEWANSTGKPWLVQAGRSPPRRPRYRFRSARRAGLPGWPPLPASAAGRGAGLARGTSAHVQLVGGDPRGAHDQSRLGADHPAGGCAGHRWGGMTCHAAIVSRGSACRVWSVPDATTVLRTGELVTVDGARGKVFVGDHTGDGAGVSATAWRRTLAPSHGHTRLCQPGDGVACRARRGAAGGWCRPAARRVHDHRSTAAAPP